jgi:hypothetical protein
MERKKLFTILLSKEGIDFELFDTNLISTNEEKFLDCIDEQHKDVMFVGGLSSKFCIFEENGIIFVAQASSWETHPEGPNNEPPGIQTSVNFWYCTENTSLHASSQNGIGMPKWEKVKSNAFSSLEKHKNIYYS